MSDTPFIFGSVPPARQIERANLASTSLALSSPLDDGLGIQQPGSNEQGRARDRAKCPAIVQANPSRKIDATDDATAGCPGSMTGGRILSEPWTFNRALALWTTTVRMGGDASRLAGMEQGVSLLTENPKNEFGMHSPQ